MRKLKLWFFLAGVFFISGCVIYLFFFSNFFSLKTVEVEGSLTCVDKEGLLNAVSISGSNFFLIKSSEIETKLKAKFVCIKSVRILKKFPNTISLEARNREPQARIFIVKNQESTPSAEIAVDSFLIDDEGVRFSDNQEVDLRIYSESKDENFKKIISILNKIKSFGIEVNEVSIAGGNLLVPFPKMIIALDKNIDIQIASLQLILSKAKIDEETVEFIDLRFDKPVVRFAPKKK